MSKLTQAFAARLREPKWRHGKRNALLLAMFLLLCILLNVGVSALEEEYGWRKDLSFNQYATVGQETETLLTQLDKDVELYLLSQNGNQDEQVYQVLNRYRTLSDHIAVLPVDIAQNPGILTRFSGNDSAALAADSVVVNCPATQRYKVLSYNDFFTSGYNIQAGTFQVEGLAYEKALTEAIVYVTRAQTPTAGILQGHGELTAEALTSMTTVLTNHYLECKTVNLLSGDSLEGLGMLLIAGPQKDLTDGELQAISDYARAGGSLFVLRDYTDPLDGMPNYLSLLKSYGVVPLPGVAVAGAEDEGSYYGERLYLLPYFTQTELTLPLTQNGYDVLLLPAACAFETPGQGDQSLTVETVLKTGPHAYLRALADGGDGIEKQEGDREGELSVALYARRAHSNGNVSRLFAIGCSAVFTDEYIYQRTFSEEFLTLLADELAPQSGLSLSIDASSAFRPGLTPGSQAGGVALLIALPLLIVIIALCVLLPRRNR